jgi:hypothetical protein
MGVELMAKSEFRFLKRDRRARYRQWAKDYVAECGGVAACGEATNRSWFREDLTSYVKQRVGFLESILVSIIVKLIIHYIDTWVSQYNEHPSLCTIYKHGLQPGEPTYDER